METLYGLRKDKSFFNGITSRDVRKGGKDF
jgi:hypothetical protein